MFHLNIHSLLICFVLALWSFSTTSKKEKTQHSHQTGAVRKKLKLLAKKAQKAAAATGETFELCLSTLKAAEGMKKDLPLMQRIMGERRKRLTRRLASGKSPIGQIADNMLGTVVDSHLGHKYKMAVAERAFKPKPSNLGECVEDGMFQQIVDGKVSIMTDYPLLYARIWALYEEEIRWCVNNDEEENAFQLRSERSEMAVLLMKYSLILPVSRIRSAIVSLWTQ